MCIFTKQKTLFQHTILKKLCVIKLSSTNGFSIKVTFYPCINVTEKLRTKENWSKKIRKNKKGTTPMLLADFIYAPESLR